MKTASIICLLPALVWGRDTRLVQRQTNAPAGGSSLLGSLGKGIMGLSANKMKAMKVEELPPKNPGAKHIRMTWGPFKIRGANSTTKSGNGMSMDKGGTGFNFQVDTDFPTDVVLLDGIVEVQSEKFKRATLEDNVYTHHFLVFDTGKPQKPTFSCDNGRSIRLLTMPGSVVMGGAAEDAEAHYATTKVLAGKKTGYHIKKNSPIMMNLDIVNYNKDDMNVYASADMEYIPGRPTEYLDASPIFVPVAACDPSAIMPGIVSTPKGQTKFSLKSTGIVAAQDSVLFVFRGHMHDGGSNIEVKVNDKVVCDSRALYGGPGHVGTTSAGKKWETIGNMVTCPDGIIVKKGDKIGLAANYDLVAHPAREAGHDHGGSGGMGGMLGGKGGEAEQMAVMIIYSAPLKQ